MICDIYDNVLEQNDAEDIQEKMSTLMWGYEHKSNGKTGINKHWHIFCGKELIEPEYGFLAPIWLTAKKKYDFENRYKVKSFKRIYCNAHTHGIEPHLHTDDGDFTMIYYPRLDWKLEYGGGTYIDGELIEYKGNRLVVFDASLLHSAMPVSRECYQLRTCVVFKCTKVNNNV